MTKITRESVVAVSEDQTSADLSGSVVILHVAPAVYYELDAVGSHIWKLMEEQPRQVGELVEAITDEYDVEAERCEAEVIALLQDMLEEGLITVA